LQACEKEIHDIEKSLDHLLHDRKEKERKFLDAKGKREEKFYSFFERFKVNLQHFSQELASKEDVFQGKCLLKLENETNPLDAGLIF
jgi:chromosome segregation ATPase